MTVKRIPTMLLLASAAASVALCSPGVWSGSFAHSGGDAEAAALETALHAMRTSEQEKLPFGAVPQTLQVNVEEGSLTIRTDAGAWSGPYDGTLFDGKAAAGADVRIARTVLEHAGGPATIVETWKVRQPKQGRSMVRSLVQETSYALSGDGATLTLAVKIEGGRLREPVSYTLTYRKQ